MRPGAAAARRPKVLKRLATKNGQAGAAEPAELRADQQAEHRQHPGNPQDAAAGQRRRRRLRHRFYRCLAAGVAAAAGEWPHYFNAEASVGREQPVQPLRKLKGGPQDSSAVVCHTQVPSSTLIWHTSRPVAARGDCVFRIRTSHFHAMSKTSSRLRRSGIAESRPMCPNEVQQLANLAVERHNGSWEICGLCYKVHKHSGTRCDRDKGSEGAELNA